MCNCIEKAEMTANDLMNEVVEKRGNAVVTERAVITTRAITFGEGGGWRLFAQVEGRYMQGKKVNKFETRLLFSFCPFCGESLTDKSE